MATVPDVAPAIPTPLPMRTAPEPIDAESPDVMLTELSTPPPLNSDTRPPPMLPDPALTITSPPTPAPSTTEPPDTDT